MTESSTPINLAEDPRDIVRSLDPALLLMSLVHITGDRALLSRYRAHVGGVGESCSSAEAVAEIREKLVEALDSRHPPQLLSPDDALFAEMAEFCLRSRSSPELLPLLRDHVRFSQPSARAESPVHAGNRLKILVIGAGMTGIIAGIGLAEAGFEYRILEARAEVGGTWSINKYPGVAVDTASQHYSLSFALNPSWSKLYPDGQEYLAYLKDVAERFGIVPNIDFNTRAERFEWNEERQCWRVEARSDGVTRIYEANVVLTATGFFSRPLVPALPGLERLRGTVVHSADWNSDLDLAGKNIVLLGSGCTGVQIAVGVAPEAGRLTIVQRQPNWIMPSGKVADNVPARERWAFENIPFFLEWSRLAAPRMMSGGDALWRVDPEWAKTHGSISETNEQMAQRCLDYLQAKLGERSDLIELLTPDYPFFAKRPMLDCGYVEILKRSNVELRQDIIERVEPDGVVLAEHGKVECDVLILATGFELDFLRTYEIVGRGGAVLAQRFGAEPRAYLGLNVPDFPNFFISSGPNSLTVSVAVGGGHNTTAEQQVQYFMACLSLMRDQHLASIDVTEEAAASYDAQIDEYNGTTVWCRGGSAHGYYRGKTGRPQIFMPITAAEVRRMMQGPDVDHYRITRWQSRAAKADAR
jgi:4-hydroxyacetophenone monooxygenase